MDTPVIDFHTHGGRWGTYAVNDNPEDFVRIMDAAGVDKSCLNCIFHGDARRGNDVVARFVSLYPERFLPVAFVTPHYPEEAIGELERAFGKLGSKFLKLYPNYYQRPIDHPGYFPIFEWANDHGIVIMSHSSHNLAQGNDLTLPKRFIPLAQRFENVRWVLAHSGNTESGQEQAVEAAKTCPNIYLETCTSYGQHGAIEFLVEGAGEDRVLFGSDMPLMDARMQVGRIVTADISDEAKKKVLGLNAIKLLDLN